MPQELHHVCEDRTVKPVKVAVVNHAGLTEKEFLSGIEILQQQIDCDFGPAWKVFADLYAASPLKPDPYDPEFERFWGLILVGGGNTVPNPRDHKTKPGPGGKQLGYHDLTSAGRPLAKAFIGEDGKKLGHGDWLHTASHELLEMLADPYLNEVALDRRDAATLRLYAQEVCDPVAPLGYEINHRTVADFVYPAWFNSALLPGENGGKYHQAADPVGTPPEDRVDGALKLANHGYIAFFDFATLTWRLALNEGHGNVIYSNVGSGGDDGPGQAGSRTERRNTGSNRWETSDWVWSP